MSVEGEDAGTPKCRSQEWKKLQESGCQGKNTGGCDVSGGRKEEEKEGREEGSQLTSTREQQSLGLNAAKSQKRYDMWKWQDEGYCCFEKSNSH